MHKITLQLFHQEGDKYEIMKDMQGVCRLTIKYCEMEDAGEYTCRIDKQEERTTTKLIVSGWISFEENLFNF